MSPLRLVLILGWSVTPVFAAAPAPTVLQPQPAVMAPTAPPLTAQPVAPAAVPETRAAIKTKGKAKPKAKPAKAPARKKRAGK